MTEKAIRQTRNSGATRERLLVAGTDLLLREGLAGTTSRAIAREADCNQALIAYHFGGINALLLQILDRSSAARMARYEEMLAKADSIKGLRRTLPQLYREDRDSGHVKILGELVAGGLADRSLGAEVAVRVEPWIALTEAALRRAVPTAAVRRRMPLREIARGVVAMFLGLELLGNLSGDYTAGDQVVARLSSWREPT